MLNLRVLIFLQYRSEKKFVTLKFSVNVHGYIVVLHNGKAFTFLFLEANFLSDCNMGAEFLLTPQLKTIFISIKYFPRFDTEPATFSR